MAQVIPLFTDQCVCECGNTDWRIVLKADNHTQDLNGLRKLDHILCVQCGRQSKIMGVIREWKP